MNGMGIYTWVNGSMYIGDYKSNVKEGFGLLTNPGNNQNYLGCWNKGK